MQTKSARSVEEEKLYSLLSAKCSFICLIFLSQSPDGGGDTKHFRFRGISCRNYFHFDFDRSEREKGSSEIYLNHVFDLHFRFSVRLHNFARRSDRRISVPRADCVRRWLSDSQAAGLVNGVNLHSGPNSPPERAALDSPAITQALSLTASISINRALFKRSLRAYNHRTDSLSCWFFRLCVSRSLSPRCSAEHTKFPWWKLHAACRK